MKGQCTIHSCKNLIGRSCWMTAGNYSAGMNVILNDCVASIWHIKLIRNLLLLAFFPKWTQCDVLTSYIKFLKPQPSNPDLCVISLRKLVKVFQMNTRLLTHAHICRGETLLPLASQVVYVHFQAVPGGHVQRQTFGVVGHQDGDTSPGNGQELSHSYCAGTEKIQKNLSTHCMLEKLEFYPISFMEMLMKWKVDLQMHIQFAHLISCTFWHFSFLGLLFKRLVWNFSKSSEAMLQLHCTR